MIALPVIKDNLAVIVLALTPAQRWDAARKEFDIDMGFMTERWFIITMVVAMLILILFLVVVSFKRIMSERKLSNQLFDEHADKAGLSERERQILLTIANYAGLIESEAVFTMVSAFDRGAARMIEQDLAQQGPQASAQLKMELSFLREKLGFTTESEKLSSRQIPEGRKVHLTRRMNRPSDEIEATVVENNDIELTVKLTMPVRITFGEVWRVHYYFGASVWEFDTSVLSYDGDVMVLNHSDDVRFVNRRRFLRVPVNEPAFIAPFPFARALAGDFGGSKKGPEAEQNLANVPDGGWGPPEFIRATVTELAGPGLRIETPLEIKVGERVLVIFKLDEGQDEGLGLGQAGRTPTSRVVQHFGEVKHIRDAQDGFSVAVELVGLKDSDIGELVRATNTASLRAGAAAQGVPASAGAEENAPEPSAVQGV